MSNLADFLRWCNEPVYRPEFNIGSQPRVVAMQPDLDSFMIFLPDGRSATKKGEFLTAEAVVQYYIEAKSLE